MDKDGLPFFYYDILARIIPGGATLAALMLRPSFILSHWLSNFAYGANGDSGLEKLTISIVLVGISYVIGTFFEVIDFAPGIKEGLTDRIANLAFMDAMQLKCQTVDTNFLKAPDTEIQAFQQDLWRVLMYRGSTEPDKVAMFAHCHRFQAEQKMFVHLFYSSLIFLGFLIWNCQDCKCWVGFVTIVPILIASAYARDRRRWLQVIDFSREVGTWTVAAGRCFTPLKPTESRPVPHSETDASNTR